MQAISIKFGDVVTNQFGEIAVVEVAHGGYTDLPLQIKYKNTFLTVDFDGTSPYNSLVWQAIRLVKDLEDA